MTFQMGTPLPDAASAIWELVVELRTGFPEIKSAQAAAWHMLIEIADRLEEMIGTTPIWLIKPDRDA